ncbi:DUF1353 domain-containing protein [Nocardioides montaniterrae]
MSFRPDPTRFYDGGTAMAPPDPTSEPRIVLERISERGVEYFRMQRRIAYRDREHGELLVPKDPTRFVTDLTSVPTIFTWLVPKTGTHLPATLLHDGLVHGRHEPATYLSTDGHVLDRVAADRVLRAAMRDAGVGPVRGWLIWSAVTLGTITAGDTAWSRGRHLRYLVPAYATIAIIVTLGVIATLDLFDVVNWLPWMGDRSFVAELFGGLAGAIAIPFVLGLTWGRFAIAGVITGIALAVLLHVTVMLALVTGLYQATEWLARRLYR